MDELLINTITSVQKALKDDDIKKVKKIINDYSPKMERLIENCSAIINSKETTTQQERIDDYFQAEGNDEDNNVIDQNSIDDLFD